MQVYFNNHPNGSGAKNAISLKKMIGKDETGEEIEMKNILRNRDFFNFKT